MGFSIRYTGYETQAALLQKSIASLKSSEALHASYAKCVGSYDDTQIQYCEFFSVCCNFVFHVTHIKQDSYNVLYILFL